MAQKRKPPLMEAIGIVFLTWKRYCQRLILPHGVTLKQFEVLRQLRKHGSLNPSEIANMLFCDRPTATVVIRNMEKQGWVKRESSADDSRRVNVTLQPAGADKLEEIGWDEPRSRSQRFRPTACLTVSEREEFSRLLGKLNEHLARIRKVT